MDSIKAHLKTALAVGEDIVDRNPTACLTKYMKELEARFGGSRASWFLGLFATFLLLLYVIGGLALITNLVGFLYPAYATFKAIDSPDAHASAQWLSYWVIFGCFFISENMLSVVVAIIPFYSVLKALFLIYCFHPYTRGATLAYTNVISPLLHKYVPCIAAGSKGKGSGKPAHAGESSRGVVGLGAELYGNGGPSVTVPPVKDLVSPKWSELTVVVISASDVVHTAAPGASVDCDPYCVVELMPEGTRPKSGPAENTKYKTGCKVSTANPVWNESIIIPEVQHLDVKLVVTVCNKRAMGKDQCLGKIELPLSDEAFKSPAGPADIIQNLSPADNAMVVVGDLRVKVHLK